jgi:hypothetical protein
MAKVAWLDDLSSIVITFDQPWGWQDFHNAVDEAHKLAETTPDAVDIVIVHQVRLPAGNPLTQFNLAFKRQPPNIRRVAAVVESRELRVMTSMMVRFAQMIERLFPSKGSIKMFLTMDEYRASGVPKRPPAVNRVGGA